MPPKKKLSKKEKARLEAEQAEMLRIEMEKEKLKKLEEARQRKKLEMEQAKHRQQQEIQENKLRRAQLKASKRFFDEVFATIEAIKASERYEHDWEKFMRCNGLPNANSPSDLRKYIHQWQSDIERRQRDSRNWLLRTDERTLLTHDANVPDLTRITLRKQQGNLGDVYSQRIKEVLGVLNELDEALSYKNKPPQIIVDLKQLKTEIRVFLKEHLDEFTYNIMSHIERDMEIDRPGVSKHIYDSDVFKSFIWTFSKDAQISLNPKARIGEQTQHNEIDFPNVEMQISLPPTVKLQSTALRGLWLNYDHFSDYCNSFSLKRPRSEHINILKQTKREWRKRKEILQSMLDECGRDIPLSELEQLTQDQHSSSSQLSKECSYDVDKLYTEYEDELNKARRRAIGPDAFGLLETDVNLRKYRIIAGVYCIDYMETPQQDKQLNAHSFIRTIVAPNVLSHKEYYQTYKPPPPPLPGVRRLPEEIEAEMRMIETALDKLALVTLQLPDSVLWFEPPIACRWETQMETLESDLCEGVKPATTTATPTEATPLSTNPNPSPLKSSPRFPAKHRKRGSQKSDSSLPVCEIYDFDICAMPSDVDIYGLVKDFVVPRLPIGFCVRLTQGGKRDVKQPRKVIYLARQPHVSLGQQQANDSIQAATEPSTTSAPHMPVTRINKQFLDFDEPGELCPPITFEKLLKFKEQPAEKAAPAADQRSVEDKLSETSSGRNAKKGNGNGNGTGSNNTASGGSNSRRSSAEEEHKAEQHRQLEAGNGNNCYMFSQLIEDLDNLWKLQMAREQQEEALNQISAQLTPNGGGSQHDGEPGESVAGMGVAESDDMKPLSAELVEVLQPAAAAAAFAYYTGISFVREAEVAAAAARNGTKTEAHDNDKANADDADDASSSDYDDEDDDEYDDDDYAFDVADDAAAEYSQSLGAVKLANGSVHDFLSKHNQSESVSDGKKQKLANLLALTQGKWSTRDVHDTKFNEDKLSIQFRTGRLGIFGFALNRYSNMPYQTWDIRPDMKHPGTITFSFTASLISLDMTITSAGYCLNNFQGGTTQIINDMLGKRMSLAELKATLISSAVDIFPDEDAFCYTEGSCEKNYIMEMHLYACMSTLALSHNFSWSRWNLLAGTRTAVLLIRELIEGKKVPYYSTLLVTPLKTSIIDCTEVSASFNSAGIAGMDYYADLLQLSQVYAQPVSLAKQRTLNPVLRDNVARILMALRPLSFC